MLILNRKVCIQSEYLDPWNMKNLGVLGAHTTTLPVLPPSTTRYLIKPRFPTYDNFGTIPVGDAFEILMKQLSELPYIKDTCLSYPIQDRLERMLDILLVRTGIEYIEIFASKTPSTRSTRSAHKTRSTSRLPRVVQQIDLILQRPKMPQLSEP